MKYLLTITLSALAVACASPGPSPKSLSVVISSGFKEEPLSAETLADPAIQALIAQCEAAGEPCEADFNPVDDLRVFDRTIHSRVMTFITLSGLIANRTYEVGWTLFDPRGELQARSSSVIRAPANWPPSYTMVFRFFWYPVSPETWAVGRWRIEITINGQLEAERSFEVIGSADAVNTPHKLFHS